MPGLICSFSHTNCGESLRTHIQLDATNHAATASAYASAELVERRKTVRRSRLPRPLVPMLKVA